MPQENVIILGATSAIAQAVARQLAAQGATLVLVARDAGRLEALAADLRLRSSATVHAEVLDATDFASHADVARRCATHLAGDIDGVLLAFGTLPVQADVQKDLAQARAAIDVNLTAAVSLLEFFAARMETRGKGWIAGISSVAGDRGRQSNYVYGAAKAGLTAYLSGLRNRLARRGVHVLTVKPGFVDTPMTHGLVNPKSPLVASPDRVARGILRAVRRRKNVAYLPWFWRGIMAVIKRVPESVFKRMKL